MSSLGKLVMLGCLTAQLAACGGSVGVVAIELSEAPGTGLLARVERVRLSLDNPPMVSEASRQNGGALVLDLEIPASGGVGVLTLEAFDAAGLVVGVAASGPVPLGGIDGRLVLYVAEPHSLGAAPIALEPPRADVAVAPLSFGAILVGGSDSSGAPVADVDVYNIYDHSFQPGEDLERARSHATVVAGTGGQVYVVGGRDGGDILAGVVFDTTIAPAGAYFELTSPAGLERSSVGGAHLGSQQIVVAGDPPLRIDGTARTITAITDGPPLLGQISPSLSETTPIALTVGDGTGSSGAALTSAAANDELAGPVEQLRTGHQVATANTSDQNVFVIGGRDAADTPLLSALRYRSSSADIELISDVLPSTRIDPAVAATDRFLIVAGGTDELGAVLSDALVMSLDDLQIVATIPMVVGRTGATAIALVNGQVLIVGGRDSTDQVISTMELYTPPLVR